MKILVTGANGRLGMVVRQQLQRRADLSAIYLISPRAIPQTAADVRADISDPSDLKQAVLFAEPDVIIHLAGVSGAACDANLKLSEAVNVTAMQVLCDAAMTAGTSRIVFSSTAAVYGDRNTEPVSEAHQVDLSSTYARMKHEAEEILREATDSAVLSSVALRIFNIYGDKFSDSLVHRLLSSTPLRPSRLQGLDTFVRDYIHAPDVAEAILRSTNVPLRGHLTLNIGSGEATSNRKLVHLLSKLGKIHYEVDEPRASFSCADIGLATRQLNFCPETLDDVLTASRDWASL
ncbi:NAD-dependent epimerase/dehydratase family protein [Paenarthrobacter sp. 2TAF44]|uniref:NAD-dependent epimerase/dehydratase family protein n=1 Tax=Paenarthrobacter sp. 2TAF44 TaxID=3233018 RepID=UPI003F9ABA7A